MRVALLFPIGCMEALGPLWAAVGVGFTLKSPGGPVQANDGTFTKMELSAMMSNRFLYQAVRQLHDFIYIYIYFYVYIYIYI